MDTHAEPVSPARSTLSVTSSLGLTPELPSKCPPLAMLRGRSRGQSYDTARSASTETAYGRVASASRTRRVLEYPDARPKTAASSKSDELLNAALAAAAAAAASSLTSGQQQKQQQHDIGGAAATATAAASILNLNPDRRLTGESVSSLNVIDDRGHIAQSVDNDDRGHSAQRVDSSDRGLTGQQVFESSVSNDRGHRAQQVAELIVKHDRGLSAQQVAELALNVDRSPRALQVERIQSFAVGSRLLCPAGQHGCSSQQSAAACGDGANPWRRRRTEQPFWIKWLERGASR